MTLFGSKYEDTCDEISKLAGIHFEKHLEADGLRDCLEKLFACITYNLWDCGRLKE